MRQRLSSNPSAPDWQGLPPSAFGKLVWQWSSDGVYSAATAYRALLAGSSRPLGVKELWKLSAPGRVKDFFWLAMHKRCCTVAHRLRHGLQDSDSCIICDQARFLHYL
jgi:hypothetical protein